MNQEELNQKLIEYAKEGKLDFVKSLVEKGDYIHIYDDYALRLASENNHLVLIFIQIMMNL